MNVNVANAEISPIELEIIYNALTAAAAEMDVTIWRTSRSTIVRELLDYSTAIFDRDGWNVAQAARIPSHLNSMSYFLTESPGSSHSARPVGARRHRHLQRPLLRRPASSRYRRLQGRLPERPAHRLRRHAVPPSRRRRLLAGQLRLERRRRSSRKACASRR